ncbi:MAG: helix-turn-helix transcriptional regulator [Saprospiraceae bacterium]|nr:helix-turn-helix transcriptional regulator [Saprospiraceae bacterium]
MSIDIIQAQYYAIESGKTVPVIGTLDKIATVFEVNISQLVRKTNVWEDDINLSILVKVKLIDTF